MLYNCKFTTYRRELSAGKRQYDGDATITNGNGWFEPAGGDLLATLGVDQSVKMYALQTEENNFQKSDKVVITNDQGSSDNYYIEDIEVQHYHGISLSRLILSIDA